MGPCHHGMACPQGADGGTAPNIIIIIIIIIIKDLTIEIQCMWNVKTKVIPVIIGVTGTISKTFRKHVSNIPGNHEVEELKKTAILGTAHILRKVKVKVNQSRYRPRVAQRVPGS